MDRKQKVGAMKQSRRIASVEMLQTRMHSIQPEDTLDVSQKTEVS